MTLSEWIERREMTGFPTFSYKDVIASFPTLSAKVLSNELYRLKKHRRIQSVHRGFYTVVPVRFKDRGIVPPYDYVGQLMAYLGKPYYICLLSAGVLLGTAHQRPQRLSIMTVPPRISLGKNRNIQLAWSYRTAIPQEMLCRTNSDTGVILYSCAELTAIDLVQFCHLAGGLSVVATVMRELVERIDFGKYGDRLVKITTLPTLQRLGYLLDVVLDNQRQAESVGLILQPYMKELKYRPLAKSRLKDNAEKNKRWKIIANQKIEPDEW